MSAKLKLNIGLVFDDSLDSNDGVSQYVKNLGTWLSGQGHQVSYLVGETKLPSWSGGRVYSLSKNQRVTFNGNRLSIPRPANTRRIKSILDNEKYDVLHVMMPHSPLMAGKIVKQVSRSTAVVGTFHIFPAGRLARLGGRGLRFAYGHSLNKFSRIVSVSSAAQSYARSAFGIESQVIPNSVDSSKFINSVKRTNKTKRIVFLGRLVKRKGCAQLIDAFALLVQSHPATELVIAGDGPERRHLEAKCSNLGITGKVTFKGYVDEDEKPALLAGADIACFPSLYGESFGIVLIEAMAAGSGVVLGGDNPGYSSVLSQQTILIINPLDTHSFAERMKLLLSDKELAAKLHSWQEDEVKQYDINKVGTRILDMYREAIALTVKNRHNGGHEL